MMTPRDRFDAALRNLHDALTAEADRLDRDIRTAAERRLHALHYDLSGIRARIGALLGATSQMLGEVDAEQPGLIFGGVRLFVPDA